MPIHDVQFFVVWHVLSLVPVSFIRGYPEKVNNMRPLVEPPPTLKCALCGGDLLLKQVDASVIDGKKDVELFVCTKCGHEQSFKVNHDQHSAHL